jgi:hypothetical protein
MNMLLDFYDMMAIMEFLSSCMQTNAMNNYMLLYIIHPCANQSTPTLHYTSPIYSSCHSTDVVS